MKLLFTGGAGYIGSHTAVEFLKHTSCTIVIIDNLSTGFIENINFLQSYFPDRVEFIQLDLKDTALLDEVFLKNNFECVLHFGASIVVSESIEKPLSYYANNLSNTINLVSLCVKYGVRDLIFSSTAAVYGEPSSKFIPIAESLRLAPINPYGFSKMMSEQVLADVSAAHHFNYVVLRYFNVAGASMDNTDEVLKSQNKLGQRGKNVTHLIKVACECALGKRKKISIFGDNYSTPDGSCIRDYIHVDDLANAHLHAYFYLKENKSSEIFNVGYCQGYSVKEVIKAIKDISSTDFLVEIAPRRAGDPCEVIANNSKILSKTKWKPRFNNLEIILESAYKWEKYL